MTIVDNKFVFVFPGQGSQSVGMGKQFFEKYDEAKKIFGEMDQRAGFSLSTLMFEGYLEELSNTANTQPALFTHSIASYSVFKDQFPHSKPMYMAGHSLGQLTACVASGALSFEDGLELVFIRGQLMKKAGEINPGGMAAILGLDIPTLEKVCSESSSATHQVQVANDNCPGQVVISGHKEAVELACQNAKAAGAKRALPLAVSIAAHSSLMNSIQVEWNDALDALNFSSPTIPLVGNVSAKLLTTSEMVKTDLKLQMQSRVRWTETIDWFKHQKLDHYFEIGNGSVLSGLIKRIDSDAIVLPFGNMQDLETLKQTN